MYKRTAGMTIHTAETQAYRGDIKLGGSNNNAIYLLAVC